MRPATIFTLCAALTGTATAMRSAAHVGKRDLDARRPFVKKEVKPVEAEHGWQEKEERRWIVERNDKTEKFWVNPTGLPDVPFDIGESYAGLLPIDPLNATNKSDSELYFWYFPSDNVNATDEILIWLNGGPGCSSLEGLFQENGPVIWQYGTKAPVKNPWTWVNLTNVVWVEQPVGTGFSRGTHRATSVEETSQEFLGFWKNFVDTFDLHGRKVYIAGESYAGYYVPYLADAMFAAEDTTYFDVQATLIYDPSTTTDWLAEQVPAVAFVEHHANLFNFNETFMDTLRNKSASCGYDAALAEYLAFPPSGPFPPAPVEYAEPGCDVWDEIYYAVSLVNPCFDVYAVQTTCPLLWDVLGFPGSFDYLPANASVYFNRSDVQRAINAPLTDWSECSDGVLDTNTSPFSGLSVLPGVIEKSARTVVAHGDYDFILLANGTLAMIQNMTWGGAQGFQSPPTEDFFVPYHSTSLSPDFLDAIYAGNVSAGVLGTLAGSGVFGTTHTERGLTWVQVLNSGHMQPQYVPSAAYRHLEFLLGRISSLSERSPFTTDLKGDWGN